jgi:hypothetical protein
MGYEAKILHAVSVLAATHLRREGVSVNTMKACSVVTLALASVILTTVASKPGAAIEKQAAAPVTLFAGPWGPTTFIQPATPTVAQPEAATFAVTYSGFSPAARAAFQRAVNIWSRQVTSSVPITISAQFLPLGTGVLGQAGPHFIWRDFPGAPRAGTWYADALANKRRGAQLDPSQDIIAQFSSNFPNWHYGSGPAPAGKYDFTTVVLHEIGHGLGFLGAGRVSSGRGSVRSSGFPYIYDRFTENGAGTAMLSFADNSTSLAAQLQSNNLFFDSARVRAANGNLRAKLFAPAVFQPGSSYSHLNEATYLRGNPNSLMTPQLGQGETIRSPGAIALAIFRTSGW